MTDVLPRSLVPALGFDPERGTTVLSPSEVGAGNWIGCPTVLHEPATGRFLLTYRERRPRGAGDERGWRCAVAESRDGVTFRDIWSVHKDELGTASMERFALMARPGGGYLLYLSYVDPADNRWRIDVVEADEPDKFDIATATGVLTAGSTGTEGVKDPVPVWVGPAMWLFASYAAAGDLTEQERRSAHATADIYATGATTFPTGLAVSSDGRTFDWRPGCLPVGEGWDGYQARLTTVTTVPGGFLGVYDGSAGAHENYEERTGLAFSADLTCWTRLTPDAPALVSPHGTGSLRYLDVATVGDEWFVYYEYARADGAHELRLNRVPRASA
ncbi:hypothetical protein [Pseudonocardia sp. MH-G8]|uniref:hypothetical protein n=1 Tax=Pseudonocardia sp. MH-G8 TaxID=1854588 RepID=UPI000BA1295D|nr:hypothetical protein [Pseudonocardia sp. MH-G8]OZM78863.1 hypothetical protein CFP66_28275 [Pseudonocardia sp. MH-G8]